MADEFKGTLKLPETQFPMRANLAQREPGFLKFWSTMNLYEKMMEQNANGPVFSFHDGPPYANGEIHIGHALNKILKDLVVKYRHLRGYHVPYVPGWDTHGLPIELRVLKNEGLDKDQIDAQTLRKKCTKSAYKSMEKQREQMKRLGCVCDWEHPYMTLNPEFEAKELQALADMVEKDLVYRGGKPVFWCCDCQTALAAAEIEYADEPSYTVYVAYHMPEVAGKFPQLKDKDVSVVIWTTTPWTLPASMAVALNPRYDYGFFPAEDGKILLMACGMKEQFEAHSQLTLGEPAMVVKGADLEHLQADHPFIERKLPLVLADYVTLDAGTGCVHTAPGHGLEDYETGVRYGIEIYNPVDNKGRYRNDTPLVGGMDINEGGKKVVQTLRESGHLLAEKRINHSYPHCWRCHQPVIFRSTDQWFLNVEAFREETLNAIDHQVNWIPSWGHDRIFGMVKDRSDWCLSRQRTWGVPIPAFFCENCGQQFLTADRIRKVAEIVAKEGSDCWWTRSVEELIGEDLSCCPECGAKLQKGKDILDVWFDSGTSHLGVLDTREQLSWPADLYLEGSDQHRGWFQTSLLTSMAVRGVPPFKNVLTHGFIVDGDGRKMSKSLGNGVDPNDIIKKYGADILRLWVASTDYRSDIRISDQIIEGLSDNYRRIRNTLRFLLGNLNDFDPTKHQVSHDQLTEIDRWILARLEQLVEKATDSYENYEFHQPTSLIHNMCVVDLSSVYLDVAKDRLYADGVDSLSRRACQTTLWKLATLLTRMLSPVLSFTAEEVWQELRKLDDSLSESVFLSGWPTKEAHLLDQKLLDRWDLILQVRGSVTKALEVARSEGLIGGSLAAEVVVELPQDYQGLLDEKGWADLCITSNFMLKPLADLAADERGIKVLVNQASGQKCPRCWKFQETTHSQGLCDRCAQVLQDHE